MQGLGTALDVAIGLVLMYLLLSLAVTAIVEYASQLLQIRANNLAYTLRRLLDGSSPEAQQGKSIFKLFIKPQPVNQPGTPTPTLFGKFEASGQIGTMNQSSGRNPSYLESSVFAKGLSEALGLVEQAGIAGAANVALTSNVLNALPDSPIKKVIEDEIKRATNGLADFEKAMAGWFDNAMGRASGIFKRWTQLVSVIAGLVVAVALNADTFAVGRALWDDDVLRAQIVAAAERKVEQNPSVPAADLKQVREELSLFPLGWKLREEPKEGEPKNGALNTNEQFDWWYWIFKILGLAFTGVALAFGAPFWFDALSKLVNIRSSGKKPAPTS